MALRAEGLLEAARDGVSRSELRELVEAMLDQGEAEEIGPLRSLDLYACLSVQDEPIPWAVEGWLARGGAALLGGEPKLGKTTTAQHLAVSLASGLPWLGLVQIRGGPYRVLYLDEENGDRLAARRMRHLAGSMGVELPELPLRYLTRNRLNLDRADRLRALMDDVADFRPDFVVFDSLVRFHGRDENDNRAMADFFGRVVSRLAADGIGSILLHHLAKPGKDRAAGDLIHRLRGASDIVAAVDEVWTLSSSRSGTRTLRHELTRWDEPSDSLDVTIERGGLTARESDDAVADVILDTLSTAASEGALRQVILDACSEAGYVGRSVSKALTSMWRRNRLRKLQTGRKTTYWLAEFAPPEAEAP
jgi:hypothetical protein